MLRIAAFEAHQPDKLTETLQVLSMTRRWRERFEEIYRSKPGIGEDYSLPTRSLAEMLSAIDVRVVHVFTGLDDVWIAAWAALKPEPIKVVTAEWAYNNISPHRSDINWENFLGDDPAEYAFRPKEYKLLDFALHPNGTAKPSEAMLKILPGVLARRLVENNITLHNTDHELILGPPNSYGPRSAVLWPPQTIKDRDGMPGMWTPKIEFSVQTTHEAPLPRIHAELSVTRFHTEPIAYTPARADRGTTISIWLHNPDGYFGPDEPQTILSCPIIKTFGRDTFRWDKGLAPVLASLSHVRFPDPNEILANPAAYAEDLTSGTSKLRQEGLSAYVVASTGQKALHPDHEQREKNSKAGKQRRPKTAEHPAGTGFLPVSHDTAQNEIAALLAELDIRPVTDCLPIKPITTRIAKPAAKKNTHVELNFYQQNDHTRAAITDALTLAEKLTLEVTETGQLRFSDEDRTITLNVHPAGGLAAGIKRADKAQKLTVDKQLAIRAQEITEELGVLEVPRSSIIEIAKPAHFKQAKRIDPYPAITAGFVAANRPPQRIHPASPVKPDAKKPPYPGSVYSPGTIARAVAAVNDALRAAGHLGTPPIPKNLPACELIAVVLLHGRRGTVTPLALRAKPGHEPVGYLGDHPEPLPYAALPKLITAGTGSSRGKQTPRIIAEFLTRVLGVASWSPDAHDRVLFIRGQSFRLVWPWLQDGLLIRNELVLPGIDPRSNDADVRIYKPSDLPGLRIVRIRERGSRGEIPRGYGIKTTDGDEQTSREAGVFPISPSTYYALNVRPDSAQTPLAIDKLDFDLQNNATKTGWNPAPLEVLPAFIQLGDSPSAWAFYTQQLRRAYLHTAIPTTFPSLMHLAQLLQAYT